MNSSFETTVVVAAHANYGTFRGEDNKFYKPSKDMRLEDFVIGQSYNIRGFTSKSSKTHYITNIIPNTFKQTSKPEGRRLPAPTPKAGDDKIIEKKPYGNRDFVKEAKGKTFSLIVAGLTQNYTAVVAGATDSENYLLSVADKLLKGIEERGYF